MASKSGPKVPAGGDAQEDIPREQIVQAYSRLQEEAQAVQAKLFDLDSKQKEHDLVADTLEGVDQSRKCYRLVGGVLVERTVGQVLPVVKHNSTQLQQAVNAHQELMAKKQKEIADFMTKYNIQVKSSKSAGEDSKPDASAGQGVLVE